MFDFIKKIFSKNEETNVSITSQSAYSDEVIRLLEKATVLKKEKKFDEACLLLKKAYSLAGERISIQDRLRLPMYLQLDKKNDEGWQDISNLFCLILGNYEQQIISNQIRIFLHKEKRFLGAVPYGIYSYCKKIESYRDYIARKRNSLENNELQRQSYYKLDEESRIFQDGRWEENIINEMLDINKINDLIQTLLKKTEKENDLDKLSESIYNYIKNRVSYDFIEIKNICKGILID